MTSNIYQILDFSIAIFAAIISIAYPLLIENINKVDDKYLSAKITGKIREHNIVKRFHYVVIACIIETVFFPVFVFFLDNKYPELSIAIIVIHVLTTFAMMIGMQSIFRLVNMFNNAQELSQVLSNVDNQQEKLKNLDSLFDISLYLLHKVKNTAQFITVRKRIGEIISESFLSDSEKQPEEVVSIIRRTFSESATTDPNNLYATQNNLTPLLYNTFQKQPISRLQYNLSWYGIIKIIKADNFKWFQQHWTFVSQYGDFLYTLRKPSSTEKDTFVFKQIMLGAALLYYEKYDWLNHIFYFSNSFPPKYNAIPSDLYTIWEITKILEKEIDTPFELEKDYNFNDEDFGARTEKIIAGKALEYLALLLIRLLTLENYWYIDIFGIPNEDIRDKNVSLTFQSYVEALRMKLGEFSDRKLRKIFKGHKLPQNWKEKANGYLDSMSNGFELSEETKKDNREKALKAIKKYLKNHEDELHTDDIPSSDFTPTANDLLITQVGLGKEPEEIGDTISEMVATSVIDQLKKLKYLHYLHSFLDDKPMGNYLIRYMDVKKTLERLGVESDESYFFVFTGIFDRNNLPVDKQSVYVPTSTTAILICKNVDKPKLSNKVSNSLPDSYDNIGDNLLYSYKDNTVSVGTYAGIEKPKQLQYVRINVDMSAYTDNFDLDKIPGIHEIL